jgi:heparan-alpha-glucosaminide N-acetyltransferase
MNPHRILSIDIFRGLTIFTMVFVNDVAGVKNIPDWMKHAGTYDNAMTFVDVVFPAFLFIVGMAIPLAMQNRQKRQERPLAIAGHVIQRTIGLVILGVFMVNAEEMNPDATLIPANLWKASLYICAILIWNIYPKEDKWRYLSRGLQALGILGLIVLWYTFRKGENGEMGMTPSWWGILGLIGWAYLLAVGVYALFRHRLEAVVAFFAFFVLINLGLQSEAWGETGAFLTWLRGQAGHFCHASLCLAGMILTLMLQATDSSRQRIQQTLIFGGLLLLAGFFLSPFGISKNLATPAWAMYSAASCALLFPLVYWLADVKRWSRWANFLKPAGTNPLLTYILPSLFYAAVGYSWMPALFGSGGLGILRSILFSLFILGVAALMTKWKVRLHL